jgi:hypothetical protein
MARDKENDNKQILYVWGGSTPITGATRHLKGAPLAIGFSRTTGSGPRVPKREKNHNSFLAAARMPASQYPESSAQARRLVISEK